MQDPSAMECTDDMRNGGHLDTPGQMMFRIERTATESSSATALTCCGGANIRNGELHEYPGSHYLCHRCSCDKFAVRAGSAWGVASMDEFLGPRSCTNMARKSKSKHPIEHGLCAGCPNSKRD